MAARLLLQRRSAAAPMAAVAALGALALAPATALAEAPAAAAASRKPIYDDLDAPSPASQPASPAPKPLPSSSAAAAAAAEPAAPQPPGPRGPTPTDRLALQVGRARRFLYRCAVAAEDRVNASVDSALDLEQSFTSTVASLAPPRHSGERLMPGAVYVLVAAMAGSIVARNRGLVARAALPLALGVAAGWAVVPLTMRNVSDLAWRYEQRVPALADAHVRLSDGVDRGLGFARVHARLGVRYVDDKVTGAREAVEGWVSQGK